jgi:glyoxylase-like metal-dependent hydrolase (beta-lactamase superfamily II)
MILQRALNQQYLSNSFVVADRQGGSAVIIDAGGPSEPLTDFVATNELEVTHLLCTHHHVDHVSFNDFFADKYQCPVHVPAAEADLFQGDFDATIADGEVLTSGELSIKARHTPGHTKGMLAFVINGEGVFTGDTLFKGTVGGTLAPGHSTFDDLKRSIMKVLMKLPPGMKVYPGHTDFTTIGEEWENNPFIRIWRGLDQPEIKPCTVQGKPAELVLRATDYDGGTKCWVRFPGGGDEIAPGSWVKDGA